MKKSVANVIRDCDECTLFKKLNSSKEPASRLSIEVMASSEDSIWILPGLVLPRIKVENIIS